MIPPSGRLGSNADAASGYKTTGTFCGAAVGCGNSSKALEVLAKISRGSGTSIMSVGFRICDRIGDTDCVSSLGTEFTIFEMSALTIFDEVSGRIPAVEEPRLLFDGLLTLYCADMSVD